jgi:hypothetical protein
MGRLNAPQSELHALALIHMQGTTCMYPLACCQALAPAAKLLAQPCPDSAFAVPPPVTRGRPLPKPSVRAIMSGLSPAHSWPDHGRMTCRPPCPARCRWEASGKAIRNIDFSPAHSDGVLFSCDEAGACKLWSADSGAEVAQLQPPPGKQVLGPRA